MNYLNHISKTGTTLAILLAGVLSACLPESEEMSLEPAPTAAFEITPVSGEVNTFLLSSTSEGGFIFQWDKGTGQYQNGHQTDTLYLPWIGEYEIKLRVASAGGADEAAQTVTIDEADPDACSGNLPLLTGCDSKTWVLMQPEGGALFVGPPGLETAWWSNTAADVNAPDRVCLFDNTYTFHAQGEFVFDNNGTMRVDDEGGAPWPTDIGLDIGCYDMEQIPEQYQAWGSGNHRFALSGNELTVSGEGAHLGLYKVGQEGTTAAPENSITYEIVSITEDVLVVKKEYGWGGWKFTFKAVE